MIYSYILVALRNFSRRGLYHGINIFGLAVGLSVVAIVSLYVFHEKTYDSFHTQSNQIVRFSGKRGDTWFATFSPTHSSYLLENNLSSVEKTVRLRRFPPKYISVGQSKFFESNVLITDTGSKFFDLFDFPVLHGNKDLAMKNHNSVVLTETVAKKLFGDKNAVGEPIVYDTLNLTVTAVIKDLPSNTHMNFSVLICNDQAMKAASAHFTYGLLSKGTNPEDIKAKLMALPTSERKFEYLQDCKIIPLKDLHYEANMTFEMKPPGDKTYLLIFVIIGSMILVLTCFNFINLSIAMLSQRTKEIAVRKVVGASQKLVFVQLLLESSLVALFCFPITLALLEFLIPLFNGYMGILIENRLIQNLDWFVGSIITTIGVGLIAGIYPSWILPRINAVFLFKSGLLKGAGSIGTRSALIGFQLLIVVIMLSGSWIIEDQLNFIQDKDLGFDHKSVLKLERSGMIDSTQFATLKTQLLSHHAILSVSHGLVPGDEDYGTPYKLQGSEVNNNLIAFPAGKEYLSTLGIKLLQTDYDQSAENLPDRIVLVNETFAKLMGEDCIGKEVVLYPGKDYEATRVVNGVFKDFNFFSLHQPMVPMMISLRTASAYPNENILIKVDSKNRREAEAHIKKVTLETVDNIPLTLRPLDESLAEYYQNENRLLVFSRVLLAVSVILSILGFVGLSSYLTELRTKEIGIRKVLGASTLRLVYTLGSSFVKITMIAFAIGSVLSFFVLKNWLSAFAYQTSITGTPFAITCVAVALILMVSVGFHALKTAKSNPSNLLRSE